jgi:hypothetical protein
MVRLAKVTSLLKFIVAKLKKVNVLVSISKSNAVSVVSQSGFRPNYCLILGCWGMLASSHSVEVVAATNLKMFLMGLARLRRRPTKNSCATFRF